MIRALMLYWTKTCNFTESILNMTWRSVRINKIARGMSQRKHLPQHSVNNFLFWRFAWWCSNILRFVWMKTKNSLQYHTDNYLTTSSWWCSFHSKLESSNTSSSRCNSNNNRSHQSNHNCHLKNFCLYMSMKSFFSVFWKKRKRYITT